MDERLSLIAINPHSNGDLRVVFFDEDNRNTKNTIKDRATENRAI